MRLQHVESHANLLSAGLIIYNRRLELNQLTALKSIIVNLYIILDRTI